MADLIIQHGANIDKEVHHDHNEKSKLFRDHRRLNEPVLFGSGENTDDPLLNIPLLSTRGLNHLADVIRGQEQLPPLKECGNGWYNFYINFNDAAPSGEADSGRHSVTASLNFITVSENAPDNGRAYEIPIPQMYMTICSYTFRSSAGRLISRPWKSLFKKQEKNRRAVCDT